MGRFEEIFDLISSGNKVDVEEGARLVLEESRSAADPWPVLHCARLLLKARTTTNADNNGTILGEILFGTEIIGYYLKHASSDNVRVQVEALTCLVNCLFRNLVAFDCFEAQHKGINYILAKLEGRLSAQAAQRCFRIMNLSIQSLNVLSSRSGEKQKVWKASLDTLVGRLAEISIGTLSYCVRGSNHVSAFHSSEKSELIIEILSLQILLAGELGPEKLKGEEAQDSRSQAFTQLGILLVELLSLPLDLPLAFQVKAKVVNLLTFMPPEYSNFLAANGALKLILEVFERQILLSTVQGLSLREQEARLVPALIVFTKAVQACPLAKVFLEREIFPGPQGGTRENQMEPENAPPGSFRLEVIQLMSSSCSSVAQLAGELLWALCNHDSSLFVKRTGLGHAVGVLQMKGLLNMGG